MKNSRIDKRRKRTGEKEKEIQKKKKKGKISDRNLNGSNTNKSSLARLYEVNLRKICDVKMIEKKQ